ncbi:N-acetylmuramoyl-L-alanine amidase [Thalassospira indica]|uniref:N-acetylmuramoyl-L-alanine amidase n=1 Tax=Thalassospira indica TaxID=1891279 RepID=A0ABM6XW50_9PROT|nr:N-acetylmuramoyl-L-alanine amidase [Thalassospira indica]AXO13923.1 N-acetylmuramoyl-L-alanine amidase [Thalassospira indica]OAZ13052.1 N-acetylmuramoyl-L-alanine amidase [Thalassospira profundimaris]
MGEKITKTRSAGNMISHPSPNFGDRPDGCPIDILVLHYTGMQSGADALERLCDPESSVSSHYLIEEDGRIFQLVDEGKRAWHAGLGIWQDCSDVNSNSIGIEIVNPGHEYGYRPFPEIQIKSVIDLTQDILKRHEIPASRIIAHSDMAPDRKEDPGELFPWQQLAEHGIGLWPGCHGVAEISSGISGTAASPDEFYRLLEAIGYGPADSDEDKAKRTIAFQRHWRQNDISGDVDGECIAIAKVLASAIIR